MKIVQYQRNNQTYNIYINYKRMKSITARFRDGAFYVNASIFASKSTIINLIDKYFDRLTRPRKEKPKEYGDDFIYLFGNRYNLIVGNRNELTSDTLCLDDINDLDLALKKLLLKVITPIVREYEPLMGVKKPYKIHVKRMSSRYGSNSKKTHSLSFQLNLVHYDIEIIKSVIIHELAHDKYFDHSSNFYAHVYKYCPNYKLLHDKLRKGVFK